MSIAIGINIIEYDKLKEPLHVNHPCSDICPYRFGYILITSIIFELYSSILFILSYNRGEIFHR